MTRTEDGAVTNTAAAPPDVHAKRWPLRVVAGVVAVGLVATGFLAWWATQSTTFAQLPAPTQPGGRPLAAFTPEPASSQPLSSAPSRAVEIYVPNTSRGLAISTSVKPLGGCRSVIDPPRNGPDVGGSSLHRLRPTGHVLADLAVLAGHSSKKLDTAFNRLYTQGSALEGQMVYLRTETSGDRWLTYRIDHVETPQQDELPYLTSVWGGDGTSTAAGWSS